MPEDVLDRLLAGESPLASAPAGERDARPRRDVVVVTCMDARVLPLRILGLDLGDAHVIRTAGVEVGEAALRDLGISHEGMGTRDAILIAHTDCRAHESDDARAIEAIRRGARRIGERLPGLRVHGVLYDLESGELTRLDLP